MKLNALRVIKLIVLVAGSIALQQCKKESQLHEQTEFINSDQTSLALTTRNVVTTVAGLPNSPGFVDGQAGNARFDGPSGIQLAKDGALYIADRNNNAIRKLSSNGVVTTLLLKTTEFYGLQSPTSVGVDNAGNVHVLSYLVDQAGLTYIFDKTGKFVAGYESTYTAFGALAKDPYEDFFWFSSSNNILKHLVNPDGSTGRDNVPYNKNLLTEEEQGRGQSYRGLFIGRNRVVYFTIGARLFKYTPNGVTAQLYPNLNLGDINSIVLNADSRTMYLAAGGKIEKIENGKLTILAGPNSATPDGQDGIGMKADVHAYSLALTDHENSLYFSDYGTNTIRKIMLK
ncbi:hypothetical protein IM792_07375 [Mucilaginibacter sp. JRF]|uniref:hypothetical protein n=1 Tax=Mucilaginibacter sp. JRF TaxID=2780088 RepID=UPI001881B9ED|nr:hypothetical protein [Mucilaginibacter sp. JRF]MBE9584262.1 hypothetical protein [Mucilaginibacter sp. JRF]